MERGLRVLVIEDNDGDFELLRWELRRSFAIERCKRVMDAAALRGALDREWDLVVSDGHLPGFSWLEALEIVRGQDAAVPFILCTGTIGEQSAVEALKAGVDDYVLKDALGRLAPAVELALRTAKVRREHARGQEEMQRFRLALDNSADMVVIIDRETMRHVDVNQTVCRLLGYSREELLGMGPADTLPLAPADIEKAYDELIADPSRAGTLRSYYRCKDGSRLPFESTRHVIRSGGRWMIAAISRDIRERIAAEQALQEREVHLTRLNRVYAVLSRINGLIVRATGRDELFREACRIAVDAGGFRMAWIGLVDRAARRIRVVASSGGDEDYLAAMPLELVDTGIAGCGLAGRAAQYKVPVSVPDMATDARVVLGPEAAERGYRSLAMLPLVAGEDAAGVLSLYAGEAGFFDAEEMKLLAELAGDISFAMVHIEKSERLDFLAYYDPLTGLANAALFRERLSQYVATARRERYRLALVLVNIERFKTINDAFGRQSGDALLKLLGERLARLAGDAKHVARVGSDHFAVVIPHAGRDGDVAASIGQSRRRVDEDPYRVGEHEMRISTRAGVALFPDDGADAEALLRNAESALKAAKDGGERYIFYAREMSERVAEKLALENKLRLALERDEFILHYQPKVDLATGAIVGAEALIRWQNPESGMVPPAHFIPLLEETGLIFEVGSWALRKAASDRRAWARAGIDVPRVAVNVSAIQLGRRDFVASVEQAIAGGPGSAGIDLEITESLIMRDVEATIGKLEAVRRLGVNIAIDDFGTGYSSLAYLARLPVQSLKVDRSFIVKMLEDPDTATLVQTIISLAHSLRLEVVAEGVELEEQAKVLRLLRCDQMQGYLFSKPLPAAELGALLARA